MIWGALRFGGAQTLALGSYLSNCAWHFARLVLSHQKFKVWHALRSGYSGTHACSGEGVSYVTLFGRCFLVPGPSGPCQFRLRIRAISQVAGGCWWPFDRASAKLYLACIFKVFALERLPTLSVVAAICKTGWRTLIKSSAIAHANMARAGERQTREVLSEVFKQVLRDGVSLDTPLGAWL